MFGILTTLIVCIVFMFGSMILTRTSNELLITPIETMITKVQKIASNPVKAAQDDEDEQLALEEIEQNLEKPNKQEKEVGLVETLILEQTLTKIGGLLALG